jgi:hypothetical protein
MLICPAIGDTDPIRRTSPSPGGHLSGNILSEAMRGQIWAPIDKRAINFLAGIYLAAIIIWLN